MVNNSSMSVPGDGMNRDKHPSDLSPSEYGFALNATIEGDDGSQLKIQNEPSTLLCKRFDGFRIIGYKNDVAGDNTYFFMVNPSDKSSKITFLKSIDYVRSVEDQLAGTGKDIHRILGERLEESPERFVEICGIMEVLIEDDKDDPCLAFSIDSPIYDIEIKDEKCGKVIYWTDGKNPPRYVMVDRAINPDNDGDFWYSYHGYKTCGDNKEIQRCKIACEKLLVFPELDIPVITPDVVEYGGSLRGGVYQFCVCLCDEFGIEKGNFDSLTNPVNIFNKKEITVREGAWGKNTGMGIRLNVSNLDMKASHYKVGVVQNTVGFNGEDTPALSYYIEGIHPVTEKTVYYLTDQYNKPTTLEHLSRVMPVYKTSRGMTSVGNRLLQYGLTSENEWNLQPVTNLMGHFLNWQTSVAREDLYADGVASSMYASVMRDEVYPFGIRFMTNTGYRTAVFPLIPRPATADERTDVSSSTDADILSVMENNPECGDNTRREKWQFRNTSKEIGSIPGGFDMIGTGCNNEVSLPQRKSVESVYATLPDISFGVSIDDIDPGDIMDYVSNNIEDLCGMMDSSVGNGHLLCEKVNAPHDPSGDGIYPPVFEGNCVGDAYRVSTITTIPVDLVKEPKIDILYEDGADMSLSDSSSLVANRSEMEPSEKMRVMFDNSTIDVVKGLVNANDCIGEDNPYDSSPQQTLMDIASVRNLYSVPQCISGCSISSPLENPTISNGLIPNVSATRANPGCTRTFIDGTGGGKREKLLDGYMDLLDDLFADYVNDFCAIDKGFTMVGNGDRFNTGIFTEWDRKEYYQIDLEPKTSYWARNNITYFKFFPYVSKYARWVKFSYKSFSSRNYRDKGVSYIELLGNTGVFLGDSGAYDKFRITFFLGKDGVLAENPFAGYAKMGVIMDYAKQKILPLYDYMFKDANGNYQDIYVSIESPVLVYQWAAVHGDCEIIMGGHCTNMATFFAPIGIGYRESEVKHVSFGCKSISVKREVSFEKICMSCGDKPINCAPRPYRYGSFSYWESKNKYPANGELYDSSKVGMSRNGGPGRSSIINKLKEFYGEPEETGGLLRFTGGSDSYPGASTVFCQKPIRHYKFPDGSIAPFMGGINTSMYSQYDSLCYIYPMGVMIDDNIVSEFLDIAVETGLITKENRLSIVGYEIYRGDRVLSKSVIGTGMGFDMFMSKDRNSEVTLYPNYPYNDLSDDQFIYKDSKREDFISHPFSKGGNIWYSIMSPDLSFDKPDIPAECVVDGYQTGASTGSFRQVEDHPKWTILGSTAYKTATSLATVEATADMIASIAEYTYQAASQQYVGAGLFVIANPAGIALTVIKMISGIAKATSRKAVDVGKYRYQWLTSFIDRGPRTNHAYYYSSAAYYNSFIPGSSGLRGLSSSKYLKGGLIPISDISSSIENVGGKPIVVNNIDRERSLFVSLGKKDYMIRYPESVKVYDNSRVIDFCSYDGDSKGGLSSNAGAQSSFVASPYFRLKRYNPGQYGEIEDVRWLSTGAGMMLLGINNRLVFGGDTFISRFSVKRKMPMFYVTQFGQGDMIPFAYNDYRNIGFPRYFCNYDTGEDSYDSTDSDTGSIYSFPTRKSVYNLGCDSGGMYKSGKIYLYFYGIPQFLVESEINCNLRLAGTQPHERFYPEVGDHVRWTQEKNVPISRDNNFMFSGVFRYRVSLGTRSLPTTFDSSFWDCAYQRPNGVIWSTMDVSENSMTDPWLSYKPMDYHEFKSSFGRLVSLKGIESEQVLARFENQVGLYNAIDVLAERVTPESKELGTGGLFASRGLEYNNTTLGYAGTQSRDMVSCEFGHFWVDLKRGQVFRVMSNGRDLKEITPGMRNWFKEHLGMKLLRSNIINRDTGGLVDYRDVDNKFMGLGLSMGWDNRFKRVLITKKDYIPTKNTSSYHYSHGKFFYDGTEVKLSDPSYFDDVSFTIGYNCLKEEWKSYLSYTPDFYIEHQHYFQSGINDHINSDKIGLWSHGLTNQSYQVFYGNLYPFIIEVPVREQYVNKILTNYQYRMDARRYNGEVNYQVNRMTGFNKACFYNDTNNSGNLGLVLAKKNDIRQQLDYPITNVSCRDILVTEIDGKMNINDYFNEVNDDTNNMPIWIKDVNDIHKEVDPRCIDYTRPWRDRLRGDWFLARFVNDVESRFKMIVRWFSNDEKIIK